MADGLSMAIVELKRDEVLDAVRKRTQRGEDSVRIIEECRRGMEIVGERYTKGEFFLSELILSGEIFKKAFAILEPYLTQSGPAKPIAKVVIATMKGDIHDVGKSIVVTLLRARGFETHDLGVDLEPKRLIEKVKEIRPEFVGLSCLMTTALETMKQAAEILRAEGLRQQLKLVIGGGVTTPGVRDYLDADFQTVDAMEGVNYCLHVVGGK